MRSETSFLGVSRLQDVATATTSSAGRDHRAERTALALSIRFDAQWMLKHFMIAQAINCPPNRGNSTLIKTTCSSHSFSLACCFAAHAVELLWDFWNCQTMAASPAKPGGLPLLLGPALTSVERGESGPADSSPARFIRHQKNTHG